MMEELRWSPRPSTPPMTGLFARIKHHLWRFGVFVPALALVTACASRAGATPRVAELSTSYPDALAVESQLLVGSLLLEETDQAISPAQAPELLLLWKAFRSLSRSDTAAQVEIDAVITQIEGTMSTEQLAAINAMQLTSEDLIGLLRQHAPQLTTSDGSANAAGSSQGQGATVGGFPGGVGPGAGGADGIAFLAPSAGQGTILSAASTEVPSQNLTTTGGSVDRAAIRLVDSLISLLESKADG